MIREIVNWASKHTFECLKEEAHWRQYTTEHLIKIASRVLPEDFIQEDFDNFIWYNAVLFLWYETNKKELLFDLKEDKKTRDQILKALIEYTKEVSKEEV